MNTELNRVQTCVLFADWFSGEAGLIALRL